MPDFQIAHYRITGELGRGGMGIVYRAEDTKLDRTVALKVLPPHALSSEEDRARFYREARAAAGLNHAHICHVYQVDEAVLLEEGATPEPDAEKRPFIAMEYVDGESLADRVAKGPLTLAVAVRIATEVAEALGAAHEAGIVHRDVKSGNVMLTKKGSAKVLDFGLAKTAASTQLTRHGSTLGTVAYMSPEQARGEEVDRRTDLWALGVVLYEMIAGRLPFAADYEQAALYGILNEDPEPLTAVRTGVPMELERITHKLLAKDPGRRYQGTADLIADLSDVDAPVRPSSIRPVPGAVRHVTPSPRPSWQLPTAALLLLLLGALAAWFVLPRAPDPLVERLMLDMEGMRTITSVGISPDSRYIAMTGYDWDGNEGLFLYSVERGTIGHVERSEGATYPWFSPSGTRLAFSSNRDVGMFVVDVPSGTPRQVIGNAWTSYWLDEDRLLFTIEEGDLRRASPADPLSSRGPNYIYSLARDTAVVVRGTERALEGAEWFFPGPRLPGSDLSIGNVQGAASFGLDPRLYILDTEEGAITETEHNGINAQPLTEDILIYQLGDDAGKIVARRIDPTTGVFRSPPVDFIEEAFFALFQAEPRSGSIVFVRDRLPDQQLVSVLDIDTGAMSSYDIAGADGEVFAISLSGDGRELIGNSTNGETGLNRIVTVDLETKQMVTRADGVAYLGLDRIDGERMLVARYALRNGRILPGQQLVAENLATRRAADTLSAVHEGLQWGARVEDGYVVGLDGEVGLLDLNGVDFTAFAAGTSPSISADGRFVAFLNPSAVMAVIDRRTGRITELTGLRGMDPNWSQDGRHLYFLSFESMPAGVHHEADVVRLPVRLTGGFDITGEPEFIMHVDYPVALSVGRGRLATLSAGDVSRSRPPRASARVGWWRHVGFELDEVLPR